MLIAGGAARIALTAIALGLVGHCTFHTRVGRKHRYASFGNAATAALMGVMGSFISIRSPFFAAAGLCLPAIACLSLIHDRDIDYARARSSEGRRESELVTAALAVVAACGLAGVWLFLPETSCEAKRED